MPASNRESADYVFISYASADRERVLPIVVALRAAGVRVWIDHEDIAGGTIYAPEIVDGIEGCAALVLMCSVSSLASLNVRQEIALAWKYRRPYLPLLLEPITIPREVEYWLEGSQWVEILDHPREEWLPRVVGALNHLSLAVDRSAMPASPPDLHSAPGSPRVSIPTPLTTLVGRQTAIEEVGDLLRSARLVTLTGTGGTGKTRLAIAVSHEISGEYRDGVVFIPLAAIRDPSLVIPTIAAALGVREAGDGPIVTTLAHVIGERQLLLVLDNLEQVIDAATDISALLVACPRLHVIAASRSPLHVSGEREYLVLPLAVPDVEGDSDLQVLSENAAVALFVERASAVKRDFRLTAENADAVAAICRRLDGLPLAIELAAARVKHLPPHAMLTRLDRLLPVLTGGARDLPQRHKTIRETIQWSYGLLSENEQRLLRCLSPFVGGWTHDAAGAVVNGLGIDVPEQLASLADKSLVVQREPSDGDPRFGMLETVREFGLEQLEASEDLDAVVRRYQSYFVSLAEHAYGLWLTDQMDDNEAIGWLQRAEIEHGNFRSVLDRALTNGDRNTGFRLVACLWLFWFIHGHHREAVRWSTAFLDRGQEIDSAARAMTLYVAGAFPTILGDVDRSSAYLREGMSCAERVGDQIALAHCLLGLGNIARDRGHLQEALDHYTRSLALFNGEGFTGGAVIALANLAQANLRCHEERQAVAFAQHVLEIGGTRNAWAVSIALATLAEIALNNNQPEQALPLLRQQMTISQQLRDPLMSLSAVAQCARVAWIRGEYPRVVTLLAGTHHHRDRFGYHRQWGIHESLQSMMDDAREMIDPEEFDRARDEGQALSLDALILSAL